MPRAACRRLSGAAAVTEWTRARIERRCGCCGRSIYVGQPMRVLTLPTSTKVRCVDCSNADGWRTPTDLPPLEGPLPAPHRKQRPPGFTGIGTLARDWKKRQSGDDAA